MRACGCFAITSVLRQFLSTKSEIGLRLTYTIETTVAIDTTRTKADGKWGSLEVVNVVIEHLHSEVYVGR